MIRMLRTKMEMRCVYVHWSDSVCLFDCFAAGRLPIAACIEGAAVVAMLAADLPLLNFASKVYASVNSFTLMAIPFFMLARSLMATGGMSRRLIRLASALVGWITGGLTHVMILASAFFAALSGSAPATCAAIGGMMIPEMEKKGFPPEFSAGVQCVGGNDWPDYSAQHSHGGVCHQCRRICW